MSYKVAVAGATGTVGRELLRTLAERGFPVREIAALSTARATGQELSFGERVLKVQNQDSFDFAGWDMVFLTGDAALSAVLGPRATAAGCTVIDTSPQFRLEADVPLVVPEVNARALPRMRRRMVAGPSPVAVMLAMALRPLQARWPVARCVVATYQSVSDAGKDGMDELFAQSKGSFVGDQPKAETFPKPIAFNVLPQTSRIGEDGMTADEAALGLELRKVLSPDIRISATCVRVPVFIGHAAAVHLEFAAEPEDDEPGAPTAPPDLAEMRALLRDAPGLVLLDEREDGAWITPAETQGEDAVYISRLRTDPSAAHGLILWVAADNLRKGSALNAVQIAEALLARGWPGPLRTPVPPAEGAAADPSEA